MLIQLDRIRPLFTSYLRIRTYATSPNSQELLSSSSELSSAIESLSEDLTDLKASVKAVESDPYKYGLEIEELIRRNKLCDDVSTELQDMREELGKSISSSVLPKTKQNTLESDANEANEHNRDNYAEFEQQQQLKILADQDVQLESVSKIVSHIRQQASDMGRELEEQAEILDRVGGLAERVGGRLQTGVKAMGTVLKRNENGLSNCCIVALIIILIILLILVLVW